MTKFVGLRAKTYSYLIDDGGDDKKEIGTRKWVIKRKSKFENNKNCLEASKLENTLNHLKKNYLLRYGLLIKIIKCWT